MPRKPRPTKPPKFFPAGEDADLLDEDGDDPQPLIEFGKRSAPQPKEGETDAAQRRLGRKRRAT